MTDRDFEGRVALVTGGGSGIGRATAIAFAREGAKVMVADIGVAGGEETVSLIAEAGGDARFIRVDVTDPASVAAMVAETVAVFGTLDHAVNNAGVAGETAPVADTDIALFDRIVTVNLRGVFLCLKYEIQEMSKLGKRHGERTIVNMASMLGFHAFPTSPAYVASKHGVIGLTRSAAIDYAAQGIRINAICPGIIDTPMLDRGLAQRVELQAAGSKEELLKGVSPLGRGGRPEEIAEGVLWLSCRRSSFMVGHGMVVDGGVLT